jgi:hypothetical protein
MDKVLGWLLLLLSLGSDHLCISWRSMHIFPVAVWVLTRRPRLINFGWHAATFVECGQR